MCEQVAASGNTLILYSACTGHYIVSCSYHSKRTPTTFFTYIKIPTHPSGVSKTTIASTACVMTQAKSPTLSYRLCGRISIGKYP